MCCCGCLQGKACMAWLLASMVMSLILILIFVILEFAFGGPFPTERLAHGSRLIFSSGTITIITCSVALLMILKFANKLSRYHCVIRWILFLVINTLLAYSVIVNFVSITFIAQSVNITEKDVIAYSSAYHKRNGMVPPAITTLEKWTNLLEIDGIPMGCCGYKDFSDYVTEPSCSSSTALQDQKLIKFKAPASCCKRPTTINGVHRNYCQNLTELDENQYLSYDVHLYMMRLHYEAAKRAKTLKEVLDVSKNLGTDLFQWISGLSINELGHVIKQNFSAIELPPDVKLIHFRPAKDCVFAMKGYFKTFFGDWDDPEVLKSYISILTGIVFGPGPVINPKTIGDRYLNSVKLEVKTGVLGCGAALELLLGDNNFLKVVLEEKGDPSVVQGMKLLRGFVIGFLVMFILLTILNVFWFNFYYVPDVLCPPKAPPPPRVPPSSTSVKRQLQSSSKVKPSSTSVNRQLQPPPQVSATSVNRQLQPPLQVMPPAAAVNPQLQQPPPPNQMRN